MATYASIKYDMDLASTATGAGSMTLLSTVTASSSSTVSFTSGIDSTYDQYVFKLINIHGSEQQIFKFNFSVDGGSNYNVSKTSTYWSVYNFEDGSASSFGYNTSADLANSTAGKNISRGIGLENDDNGSGILHLYNPASTTFVKHFMVSYNELNNTAGINVTFPAGYANTTSAINAIRFEPSAGTFDGIIKMYGIS